MYNNSKYTTQIVRVDVVDVDKNEIHCKAKDGGRIAIKIPISNGFYRIPKPGEHWIVRRNDSVNWYFEGVVLQDEVYGSAYPKEGDVVISAANNVNISGEHMFINNMPVGVPAYDEFDILNSTDQIELSNPPLPDTIQVFNNSLLIPPSKIIIREETLLFSESLSTGKVIVYYSRVPVR